MRLANLVAERSLDVGRRPVTFVQELRKSLDSRGDAFSHQLLGVSVHQRLHVGAGSFIATALTQLMMLCIRTSNRADQTVVGL